MNRYVGKRAPAQLTAWIDHGREASADSAANIHYPFLQQAPSLPAGNDRLVVLRKIPVAS